MYSYLRLLVAAIFIIAVSMTGQRVDALALPAPAIIPRYAKANSQSSPTNSQNMYTGQGGSAMGGAVTGNGGNGGQANSVANAVPQKPDCEACDSRHSLSSSTHGGHANEESVPDAGHGILSVISLVS
ncbi:hypothetical protein MPER_04621 [Moniliophthora perniciosa FA553]|nr:hypothetical protein MPER_04621 [Moniliophthora perniciosa FA553]